MEKREDRLVEYERLNLLGKAVMLGGAAVRVLGLAIDAVLDQTASIVADAERAFRQGLDPNVEDARILEEYTAEKEKTPTGGQGSSEAGGAC